MKKRLFSLLLALCMVLSLLPFGASAAEIVDSGTCGENVTWALDANGLLTISGEGAMTDYEWGHSPFYYNQSIRTVLIEPGVTSIGTKAFSHSPNLTSVTMPDTVASIGEYAFYNCASLTEANIPDGMKTIGANAFEDCASLTEAIIPEGVTRIDDSAFKNCAGLTSVTLPDSLGYIDVRVFSGCTSLTSIVIPDTVSTIEMELFSGCTGLTSVTIPDSVTYIGHQAFAGCTSLASITIPDSVTGIGGNAFSNCTALRSIVIPKSIDNIQYDMFLGCTSLQSVTLPDTLLYIYEKAFMDCTSLTDLIIPKSVQDISGYTFSGCIGLRQMTVHSSLTERVFENCTGLKLLTMTRGNKILAYALGGCTALKAICLPASLEEVEANAFRDAAALTDVYFAGTQEQWEAVNIRSTGNAPLLNATVHFGGTPLAVVSQPQDVSVNAGETASFSTLATLENAAYQWQYSTDGIMWNTLENETTDTLTLTAASGLDGRLYRCEITCGGETVYTDVVTLTVYSVPVIRTQPQAVTAHADDKATFSVAAVGENLKYQWQYSEDGGNTWKNSTASSAKTPALSFTAKASFNGRLYRCVVSNPGASVTSEAVTLTIAPKITKHPQDVSVNVGESITFSVTATGANLTYLWQYSTDGGETWKNSAAKKAASITMAGKVAYDGRLYRCAVTSGDTTIYSDPAMLRVDNPLVITKQPISYTGAIGDMASFTIAAQGNGLTYRWEYSDDGGETWWQSTASSKTVKCRVTADRDGRIYRCVVTDDVGRTLVSSTVTLTVARGIEITAQPRGQVAEAGTTVKFRVTAQGDGLTYQWQLKTPRGDWKDTTAVSGKTAALSVVATAGKNAYQYRCVITDASGNQVISEPAILAVYS